MLRVLPSYGDGNRSFNQVEDAAFGIDLHPALSEDAFDRQPLVLDGYMLVADVRLDNRDDLLASLGRSFDWRETADSEILLRAWLRWGEACLDRLVGDYAFAVYSTAERRLSLVRDHAGERPLFWARDGQGAAFASMPSGLLALPRFRQGLNFDALALVAAEVGPTTQSSYFQSIQRVLPGQIVTIANGKIAARSYWQPNLEGWEGAAPENLIDEYRGLLDNAVRARLRRSSGPVAAQLSSGLDSNAVAATAARIEGARKSVLAFTSAPRHGFAEQAMRGRMGDESTLAALTARQHGMTHRVVRTSGSGIAHLRSLVATSQEPFVNVINLGWLETIGELAQAEGARTLLTGEFGNLTLHSGGIRVLGDFIGSGRWGRWLKLARAASQRPDLSWRGILMNSFEPWVPQRLRRQLYDRFMGTAERSASVFLRDHWIGNVGERIEAEFFPARSANSYADRVALIAQADSGAYNKGFLARHGVDLRAPLADRRIFEFSLRLPRECLFSGTMSQPLARLALADRLPRQVLDNPMRGQQSADWFEHMDLAEILSLIEDIEASHGAREIIDFAKLRDAVAHWPSGGFQNLGMYQRLAGDLPAAIATGLFIVEAERWLRVSAS